MFIRFNIRCTWCPPIPIQTQYYLEPRSHLHAVQLSRLHIMLAYNSSAWSSFTRAVHLHIHPSKSGVLSSTPRLPSSKLNRPSRSSSFHAAYAYPNGKSNSTLQTISIAQPRSYIIYSHNSQQRHNHPLQIKIILRIHPNTHTRRQRSLHSLEHKRLVTCCACALLCASNINNTRGCGCGDDSGASSSKLGLGVFGGGWGNGAYVK